MKPGSEQRRFDVDVFDVPLHATSDQRLEVAEALARMIVTEFAERVGMERPKRLDSGIIWNR